MRRRCAYLTMIDFGDFVSDADMSFEPMAALGWDTEMVPWRDPDVDWNDYDLVYICTPWDYQDYVEEFLAVLESIEASSAILLNVARPPPPATQTSGGRAASSTATSPARPFSGSVQTVFGGASGTSWNFTSRADFHHFCLAVLPLSSRSYLATTYSECSAARTP